MTPLRQSVVDYLAMRRALGFKLKREGRLLPDFVAHLESHGANIVTRELALSWAVRPTDGHPAWWATRLVIVRGFARYLHAFDPRTDIPPSKLLNGRYRRRAPYLFSESEVVRLFEAAQLVCTSRGAATLTTLAGLLVSAGLRVGEPYLQQACRKELTPGFPIVREDIGVFWKQVATEWFRPWGVWGRAGG